MKTLIELFDEQPLNNALSTEVFSPDTEMEDYQWWLAREEGGGWQLVTWGY